MTEQLIGFKTAKLAKEKGFNLKCTYYYKYPFNKKGKLKSILTNSTGYKSVNEMLVRGTNPNLKDTNYLAPTQSLLQKWLSEVHKINFFIDVEKPHEVLELGLQEALNLKLTNYEKN